MEFSPDIFMLLQETHMKRFRHKCLKEDFCWQRHDPEHCKYFSHAPTADDIKNEEMRRILEEKGSGWHYEKLTLEPLPYRNASVYQRQNPPLSVSASRSCTTKNQLIPYSEEAMAFGHDEK